MNMMLNKIMVSILSALSQQLICNIGSGRKMLFTDQMHQHFDNFDVYQIITLQCKFEKNYKMFVFLGPLNIVLNNEYFKCHCKRI